jgi:putative glutamine amidotransferase
MNVSSFRSAATPPVIAVVGGTVNAAVNFSSKQIVCCVSDAILALIRDHNGIPLILPDRTDPADAAQIMRRCDGLLLPPGRDIDPSKYGAASTVTYGSAEGVGVPGHRPTIMAPDLTRDEMEIALFKAADAASKPVLGICRGMQVINVARGGSLVQELPYGLGHFVESDGWIPYHTMTLNPASRLSQIITTTEVTVSSVHHQGIDRIGDGLVASGHASDGVIEAIEDATGAFIVGLQSHPEKTRQNFPQTEQLFAAFVAAAAGDTFDHTRAVPERSEHV